MRHNCATFTGPGGASQHPAETGTPGHGAERRGVAQRGAGTRGSGDVEYSRLRRRWFRTQGPSRTARPHSTGDTAPWKTAGGVSGRRAGRFPPGPEPGAPWASTSGLGLPLPAPCPVTVRLAQGRGKSRRGRQLCSGHREGSRRHWALTGGQQRTGHRGREGAGGERGGV